MTIGTIKKRINRGQSAPDGAVGKNNPW